MAGFDTQGHDEFSVGEILRELKESPNGKRTVESTFDIDDILAEFGTQSGAEPAQKSEPVIVEKTAESTQKLPEKEPDFEEIPMEKPQKESKQKQKKQETPPKKKEKPAKKKIKQDTSDLHPLSDYFGSEAAAATQKPKREKVTKQKKPLERKDGPSVAPQEYVEMKKSAARLRGLCAVLLLFACAALFYLCFAPTLGIPIPAEITFAGGADLHHILVLVVSVFAMLIGFPVLVDGIRQFAQMRLGVEAALTFAQAANLLHILMNLCFPNGQLQQPYAPVAVFALFFAVCGLWKRDRARIRACKAAGMSKEPLGVYSNEWYREINIIKQPVHDQNCFARRVEDPDVAVRFWSFLAPLVIAAALIFSVPAGIVSRDLHRSFWTLAAVSSAITPFFALYAFAQPYSILTRHLSGLGSAITGWYAAETLTGEQNLIIRDSDLFPKGSTAIHGIKMLGHFSLEQTLSYVTSVFQESNNGLFPVFYEELKSKFGRLVAVRNMRHYESGGVEAELEGNQVLIGTGAFMIRMGVQLGEEKDAKNVVFVAINGSAAGVFHIKYKGNEEIRDVLLDAIEQNVKPVLAVVDFNLTPMMVEQKFDLPTDSMEYPNIEDRLDLATDSRFLDKDACAFVTRSGFVPFASCLLAAKRLRKITMRNVLLTALCVFFGMMVMFCLTWMGNTYASAPYNLFWYQLLWMLPMLLISQRVK